MTQVTSKFENCFVMRLAAHISIQLKEEKLQDFKELEEKVQESRLKSKSRGLGILKSWHGDVETARENERDKEREEREIRDLFNLA